jgi:hypothetical protein
MINTTINTVTRTRHGLVDHALASFTTFYTLFS